ncbi:Non-SMC condensin I complex subunit G [Seminavis robusta]|uniref:Non-SMC condensin I complex subunit G n=1 Tax=Seminavis robusta TaxID=568900 RepID=A0A9N8DUB8_9STRA|nr:Non-SMC condensin I complex subunit G [Seminavis robusta]|eukprot:Sro349_g123420.1 Non-SMC condensin I complex subunit G (1019) ;mRNA; r:21921-25086
MTKKLEKELRKVLLPHFESYQKQGQLDEACELSVDASAKQLMTKLQQLEVSTRLESLTLNNKNDDEEEPSDFEEALGRELVQYIDATVSTEASSDLQDCVDRVLSLSAAIAIPFTSSQDQHHVGSMVLSRALDYSVVLLERVRGHGCLLLGKLVTSLKKLQLEKTDNTNILEWIDESLVAVEETLEPRLQDKAQMVRSHAIKAAGAFFVTPDDEEAHSDILEAMMWNMAHDPSVNNRIVAVQCTPANPTTMDELIARVRDIKPKVRAEALTVLAKKTQGISHLTEAQMVDLIRFGLTERCQATKKAASKMICCGWMKSAKYDPIALLQSLNVLDNEDEANRALEVVMEAAQDSNSDLLEELSDPEQRAFCSGVAKAAECIKNGEGGDEEQQLQPEKLFFLRARCKSVLASKTLTWAQQDAITNKLIPDVPLLCEVIGKHATMLIQAIDDNDEAKGDVESFICLQLLQLAEVSNLSEEGSRRHFAYVMKDMLSSIKTPDDLVEGCIQALRLTCVGEDEMAGSISAIIKTINSKETGETDTDGEEEPDAELTTIKLVRTLSVLTVYLETASSELSSNPAVDDFVKCIVPSVTHNDTLVREAAIGCFGKLGLFADETTLLSEFKPLMLQVAAHEDEKLEIRAQALLALADWSMIFSECLTACHVGDNEELSFTEVVRELLDDARISAVCVASEVAAKLLFAGKVCDSEWMAKLLTIYFHPHFADMDADDEDIKEVGSPVRLQQLLGLFFPAVCIKEDSGGRDALMGSIASILDLVYVQTPTKLNNSNGKKSRKKVTWPVKDMVLYVCETVNSKNEEEEDDATVVQGSGEDDPANTTTAGVSVAQTEAVDMNSSSLLASIQLADFLAKQSHILTTTDSRTLCKLLGAADFDAEEEETKNVKSLKETMEVLGTQILDETSLNCLSDLNEYLAGIEFDSESEEEEEPGAGDIRGTASDDDEGGGDDNEIDLSDDLMKSLEELKIDEPLNKENPGKSTKKRSSKGRKNSGESTSTRRSRRLRTVN